MFDIRLGKRYVSYSSQDSPKPAYILRLILENLASKHRLVVLLNILQTNLLGKLILGVLNFETRQIDR
jgi:hypothetical protein